MLGALVKTVFGSSNDRYVKSLDKIVQQINALEPDMEALSEKQLQGLLRRLVDDGVSPSRWQVFGAGGRSGVNLDRGRRCRHRFLRRVRR